MFLKKTLKNKDAWLAEFGGRCVECLPLIFKEL